MTAGTSTIFRDAVGRDWVAIVHVDHGSNEHSIVAFVEGSWLPLGPAVNGLWSQDTTPVPAATPLVNYSIQG